MDMEFVSKFTEDIGNFVLECKDLLADTDGESVNARNVKARQLLIEQLATAMAQVNAAVSKLDAVLVKAKANHKRDMMVVDSIIAANTTTNIDTEWKTIARKAARPMKQPLGVKCKIKFTEALGLTAIRVASWDQVAADGDLYYVESADHFAFRLAGRLIHGNIGLIYTDEKNPEKIRDCKFTTSCTKRDNCDYYHDPIKFPGSRDKRNYIASSWMYSPPGSSYKNRSRSRRFGSRDNLDIDYSSMTEEEIGRFHSQAMNDLLCSLLLPQ